MTKKTGEVQLAVFQNIDSAEVLLHFRSLLGGRVGRQSASTGSRKALLQWRVYGPKMTVAADMLSRVPSMKQTQLLLPTKARVAENDRARVGQCLQMLKLQQHVPNQWSACSWPYFAGFFDADEGCTRVTLNCAGLQLRLGQVSSCLLVSIFGFLQENEMHSWSLHHRAACSSLLCSKMPDCKKTLDLLLANGLKRQQAQLALTLSAENHLQIRDAISSMKGLQGRYGRLDTDGIARARNIHSLQLRLRYTSGAEDATMLSQLQKLRAEHRLQRLISRCDLLRKDMRRSLRQRGEAVSATNCSS